MSTKCRMAATQIICHAVSPYKVQSFHRHYLCKHLLNMTVTRQKIMMTNNTVTVAVLRLQFYDCQ